MRIIYNYIFNVTKKLKREDMIPFLLDFFEKNNLKYKDVLFKLFCYKLKESKRETYFEKLYAKDIFWNKYKTIYDSNIAKDTYVTGVSNLENDSWRRKLIELDGGLEMLIGKIQDQFEGMPKTGCNYRLVFNDMTWSIFEKEEKMIFDQWTSYLYPLSSNVTLWEDYLHKRYITLNFEMNIEKYDMFVNAFLKEIDSPCRKEVTFVLDDSEKEKYNNANILIHNLLNEINRDIQLENAETLVGEKLHIKKTLQKVFQETEFQWESASNGIYTVCQIDCYNNKMVILFDYEKESKCFGATLTYEGAGYKHFVKYHDMKSVISDSNIFQYAHAVLAEVRFFEKEYVPKIVERYSKTPIWFKWD